VRNDREALTRRQLPTIILLNGPPGSGKDTAAEYIESQCPTWHVKMADPIKDACAVTFAIPRAAVEDYKDQPCPAAGGQPLRPWLIDYSEEFMKPRFGAGIFGILLARKLKQEQFAIPGSFPLVVVSDAGFGAEVDALRQHFIANYILIRLYRDGHTFENDSRSYISPYCLLTYSIRAESVSELEDKIRGLLTALKILA